MPALPDRAAFTLVELLVVVTIIIVLLALLMPALDRAIYQAELVACQARPRAVAQSVTIYANEYRRYYPNRPGVTGSKPGVSSGLYYHPNYIRDPRDPSFDDRRALRPYLSINKTLTCPLSPKSDLEDDGANGTNLIVCNYYLWYGWQYRRSTGGNVSQVDGTAAPERGMFKLGDRWSYRNRDFFNLIACDEDAYTISPGLASASHPDNKLLGPAAWQNVGDASNPNGSTAAMGSISGYPAMSITWCRWDSSVTPGWGWQRDPLDRNFAFADGSALRINRIVLESTMQPDDRMLAVWLYLDPSWDTNQKAIVPRP